MNKGRCEKAKLLLEEVKERKASSLFLSSLEKESEHMGHRYIVSLLRGQVFAGDEEMDESKSIFERMKKTSNRLVKELNVEALVPHLRRENIVTNDELEKIQNPLNTTQDKAWILLTLLKTKGPTAHSIFVHKCLAEEKTHLSHTELYSSLTGGSRKRKASTDVSPQVTKVSHSYPCHLQPPEGITTVTYLCKIKKIRQCHLIGRDQWQEAEKIYLEVMRSPDNPLEMKIAVLLESCTMYITDNRPEEVIRRVKQAKDMCIKLYSDCNAQVLQGRCEWVLAKLFRYMKENDKALSHISTALSENCNFKEGEDKALVNYCHACILLGRVTRTPGDERKAIDAITVAIGCASQGDYGLDISHCKIRLAQAYVGSSTSHPGKNRGEVSKQNIEDAKRVLSEINQQDLQPRTRCMYLYTWSDVYRIDGQMTEAITSAEQALAIAQEKDFKTEIKSAKIRQDILNEERTQ